MAHYIQGTKENGVPASSRFLAAYGDQAWVQELAGGGGEVGAGYVHRLNWGLHEVHTEDYA